MAIGSSSNAMTKGLKVAFDQRDGGETASCSSTEMSEMPEANVSLQALSALSRQPIPLPAARTVHHPSPSSSSSPRPNCARLAAGALRARAVRAGLRGPRG